MMITERIVKYIDTKGITKYKFCKDLGLSNGFLDKPREISTDKYANILEYLPEVNPEWLLTGKGSMQKGKLKETQLSISQFKQHGYAPYYSDLLVSAGQFDLMNIEQREEPESWIKFPGIEVDGWFPIIGCSMEPKIYAGDMVGVRQLEQWERIDPDKTYLIITHDDRMIKHLEIDTNDNTILWAVSENYKRFKIIKEEIIRIFCVVWAGRLV